MKKNDLAKRLAKDANVSPAEAADQLDAVMYRILERLRGGKKAALPGLGKFNPGPQPSFEFEGKKSSHSKRRS